MDNEDDGRIQSLEQLVEELRAGYNELLESTEKTVDRFENENAELKREIASLKEKLENKDSEEEEEDEGGEPDFPEAEDNEDPKNLDPDAYITGATGTEVSPQRKSIDWAPDLHATIQLNEFDDAPSVGNLSIKREGKKLLLTDPDGTSGQRKWMVPLRRETTGAIELKWAQLGEGSDSDSDSDSDFPCQDEYTLDESDGDCGTTISLKRQAYKHGTGGQCEPDGDPEDAGSVTIPDPPAYSLSVGGTACQKTVTLQKTPCGGSSQQAGDSLTIDVPPTISATSTGSTAGGAKAGTVTVTPCGGSPTNIDIYNGKDGSDGDDGCSPTVSVDSKNPNPPTQKNQATLAATIEITPCGGQKQTINVYNGQDGEDGQDGSDGDDGVGIASIQKTGTSGLVDTYTITLTNCNTYNFTVTNGKDGDPGSASVSTDTDQNPGDPPGESVAQYGGSGGPLQIRGFQEDAAKALRYPGEGHTSGITLANAEVIVRDTTGRNRTEYVPASTFWLQGATAAQNYAQSIKLGDAPDYITIDTVA